MFPCGCIVSERTDLLFPIAVLCQLTNGNVSFPEPSILLRFKMFLSATPEDNEADTRFSRIKKNTPCRLLNLRLKDE
jgi:hypothetical protein